MNNNGPTTRLSLSVFSFYSFFPVSWVWVLKACLENRWICWPESCRFSFEDLSGLIRQCYLAFEHWTASLPTNPSNITFRRDHCMHTQRLSLDTAPLDGRKSLAMISISDRGSGLYNERTSQDAQRISCCALIE